MWAGIIGQCTLFGSCVQSANYPQNYGANEECTIEIDEANAAPIIVESFQTQRNADYLIVNGVHYSGRSGPHGVVPTGSITWSSNARRQRNGWRLCMPDSRAPPPARLLGEAAEPDAPAGAPTAPGIPGRIAQQGGPAPSAEVEGEADIEASIMLGIVDLGIVAVAAGGSLWALGAWCVLQRRAWAPRRGGPMDSDATSLWSMEVYIDVGGEARKDPGAAKRTDRLCEQQPRELPGEEESACLPLV